jgi:hypothetical protein
MEHETTIEIIYTSVDLCPRDILIPTNSNSWSTILESFILDFMILIDFLCHVVKIYTPFWEGQSCRKLISYSIPTYDVAWFIIHNAFFFISTDVPSSRGCGITTILSEQCSKMIFGWIRESPPNIIVTKNPN